LTYPHNILVKNPEAAPYLVVAKVFKSVNFKFNKSIPFLIALIAISPISDFFNISYPIAKDGIAIANEVVICKAFSPVDKSLLFNVSKADFKEDKPTAIEDIP
jgi:hypothetical protein